MRHIKTFESYSVNEEEGIRKFFTGHDSSEDRDKAMIEFTKSLDEAEVDVNKKPEQYVFNKEALLKAIGIGISNFFFLYSHHLLPLVLEAVQKEAEEMMTS